MKQFVLMVTLGAAVTGTLVLNRYPFPEDDFILTMVAYKRHQLYQILYWGWRVLPYTTSAVGFAAIFAFLYVFGGDDKSTPDGTLPPYPAPKDSEPLQVVLGEVHHQTKQRKVAAPKWRILPERGLYTGTIAFGGIGSGKTTAVIQPMARQILNWRAKDPAWKVGGIVLEVKGGFCRDVKQILDTAGRSEDYIELGLEGKYRYNPLHNKMDAFALAYSIGMVITQLHGKGNEPFWQQAYTNLMKFLLMLNRVETGYCTFFDLYTCAISPALVAKKIAKIQAEFATIAALSAERDEKIYVVIDQMWYIRHGDRLRDWEWATTESGQLKTETNPELLAYLDKENILYKPELPPELPDPSGQILRLAYFEAVHRWYTQDWMSIEQRLRTSIVEGITFFLSMFDSNPELREVFCPPKECYDPVANADGKYGTPLPEMTDILERGWVLALNFPQGTDAAKSKLFTCMLKLNFQQAMINRIPKMALLPNQPWRPILFLADEYHEICTVGQNDPGGDEKFFALSRQSKCIPVVVTQGISSLLSTLPRDSWQTLVQHFRTQLFMSTADTKTAEYMTARAGKTEQVVTTYSMSENAQEARPSMITGRVIVSKTGLTVNKSYSWQLKNMFEPNALMEMPTYQAVAFVFDGREQHTPTRMYLKPYYVDPNIGYFEQREKELI